MSRNLFGARVAGIFARTIHLLRLGWNAISGLLGRREIILQWGKVRDGVYFPTKREAGFFSQCSTSLADLGSVGVSVTRVVSRRAFREFRTVPGVNSWSAFFRQPVPPLAEPPVLRFDPHKDHHAVYQNLDIARFQPLVQTYFAPSKKVLNRTAALIKKYRLDLTELIAVNIRGTDKHTEIPQPPVERYLTLAREMRATFPTHKVLLVTDQTQYILPFKAEFGADLITFSELPTTRSDASIHSLISRRERESFGVTFFAAVLIISGANGVITHTGNGAFWTALFRGHTRGFVQVRGLKEVHRGAGFGNDV